jgi:hypothetical protein
MLERGGTGVLRGKWIDGESADGGLGFGLPGNNDGVRCGISDASLESMSTGG